VPEWKTTAVINGKDGYPAVKPKPARVWTNRVGSATLPTCAPGKGALQAPAGERVATNVYVIKGELGKPTSFGEYDMAANSGWCLALTPPDVRRPARRAPSAASTDMDSHAQFACLLIGQPLRRGSRSARGLGWTNRSSGVTG
jgi:hypothetical protein